MAAEESAPDNSALVEKGRASYSMFCQACHGPEDPSIESPSNLFDNKWYHSVGTPETVEKTIKDGILEKGMPGWGQMISQEEIDGLTAYLLSFQNTDNASNE